MKKLGIMVTVFLFYSSLFPYSLLALENIEDGEILTEEIELEVKQEQSMESELESSKEQVIIKDNEEETQSTNEIDAHLNSEYRNQEQSIIKSNGESIPKSTSKDELDVSIKEDSGIQEVPQKENTSNKVEYNELGIKIGTMVHGEDISKLSEEELQYIPIDWRDGKVESEHRGGENVNHRTLMRTYQSFPNVNNYILSRNLGAAKIEYDHKKEFTKFNYRYGFGKVEGVVAHETANNSSTITSEITYMSKNHKNAFVHAFVDHSRIIEIHPTDLGAWGAGRFANQRFVHVELVRVHIFDQFARSINNFSDYIASVLYKYGLVVTSAENTGQGSLWSHAAVSRFLGGTNHVDPHGYFANWGYNWNDFVKLVTMKYNKLAIEKQSTSKLAHVKSSVSRIYSDPTNPYDYSNAGSQNTNEVFYIKEQVNVNGITYYLISRNPSNKSGTIGWMQAKDLNSYKHNGLDKKDKNLILKGTGKAYTKAWGGGKNLVLDDLATYAGTEFKVNLTELVGSNVWYRGMLKGKQVWIHSSYVMNKKDATTSKLGHINNAGVKIYSSLEGTSTVKNAGETYTNRVYYIKKQDELKGVIYYLISQNPSSIKGVVGWVKATDVFTHAHSGVDKNVKTFYVKGTGRAYIKAWGGSQDVIYTSLTAYKHQEFKVHLTEKVGNNIWYRGILNGKTVWIHSDYITDILESNTSKLGHIRNSEVKIYPSLNVNSTVENAGALFTNYVYYIKKQASKNKQLYYLISNEPSSSKGIVGWVKANDLSIHTHLGVDKKTKSYYLKGTGSATSKAWGGSKDIVYQSLTPYKRQEFKVHLTEKVGNNIWYRGSLKGKTVWIHHSNLINR